MVWPPLTHQDAVDEIDSKVSKVGGDTITVSGPAVKGLVVKGAASQTANLVEAQDNTGTVALSISPVGTLTTGAHILANIVEAGSTGVGLGTQQLLANSLTAARKGLVVRGAVGQTANLAEFQNSAGTVLVSVDASGNLTAKATVVGTGTFFAASGALHVRPRATDDRGLIIGAQAGQTANLAEFQNSAGTILASVAASGDIYYGPSYLSTTATGVTGDTQLFIYYSNGTTLKTARVTIGAPDTGGSGFRVLRLPN